MEIVIRTGSQDDFERLDAIRAAAFGPVFASFRSIVGPAIAGVAFRDAEREQHNHLRELLASGAGRTVLVAECDGVAQGFCAVAWSVETGVGEIGLNAVDPAVQRRGIGRRLYTAGLDRLRVEGMRVATAGTGGDNSHAPARAANEKAGFVAAVPSLYLYRLL
jgi:predicted N-acetyltransferase YhbS